MPRAKKSAPKPRQRSAGKRAPSKAGGKATGTSRPNKSADATAKHPGGRPTLFTPKNRKTILAALALGAPLLYAAASARVSYRTLREWIVQGERDETAGLDTDFAQFSQAVREAESKPMLADLATLNRVGKKNWQAASTRLRMRYPAVFGRQVVDHREMSEAEAAKILADALGVNEDALPRVGEA